MRQEKVAIISAAQRFRHHASSTLNQVEGKAVSNEMYPEINLLFDNIDGSQFGKTVALQSISRFDHLLNTGRTKPSRLRAE